MSERQCGRVYEAHQHSAPLFDEDEAIREVQAALTAYDQAMGDLVVVSMTAKRDTTRMAAIAERSKLRGEKLNLMQIAVVLTPQSVMDEMDRRQIIKAVVEVFEKWEIPAGATEEVVAALEPRGSGKAGRSF